MNRPEPDTYKRGLTYLAANQNAEGFWGAGTGNLYLTSFSLVAFLNCGETTVSDEYGKNVKRCLSWMLRQKPTSDLDGVSMIHALTAAYKITRISLLGTKATRHRANVDPARLSAPCAILFRITVPPDAPSGRRVSSHFALRKFVALPSGPAPLRLYLMSLAMFVKGGSTWKDYSQKTLDPLITMQAANGSFSLPAARSPIESTVFALLQLTVCYRYWIDYLNIGPRT